VDDAANVSEHGRSNDGSEPFKPGCGIAFFGVFFLAGFLAFVMIILGMFVPEWRANHEFLPVTCMVLDKRVTNKYFDEGGMLYRPEIQIRYEFNGRKYEVWTYSAVNTYSSGSAGKDAIISRFQVGAQYPC
jgi:hypothetical protein